MPDNLDWYRTGKVSDAPPPGVKVISEHVALVGERFDLIAVMEPGVDQVWLDQVVSLRTEPGRLFFSSTPAGELIKALEDE
jgi:hypothetical protein